MIRGLFLLSVSFCYQHQPQEIQQNKYYCKCEYLLNGHRLACYQHKAMIKNTADTAAFDRSDKKFCKTHTITYSLLFFICAEDNANICTAHIGRCFFHSGFIEIFHQILSFTEISAISSFSPHCGKFTSQVPFVLSSRQIHPCIPK